MQWVRDSLNASKPLGLGKRTDTVLYRPLPYPLPVPAFKSQVGVMGQCTEFQCRRTDPDMLGTCNDAR